MTIPGFLCTHPKSARVTKLADPNHVQDNLYPDRRERVVEIVMCKLCNTTLHERVKEFNANTNRR